MASIESCYNASFSLKSNDISISDVYANYPVTNTVGTINADRTSITWYSVNFRDILGAELYNQSEMFNLRLNTVSYTAQAGFGATAFDRLTYFQVSGPAWENNSYSTVKKCNTNSTVLGAVNFNLNTPTTQIFDNSFVATFRKQPTCDITINLLTMTNSPPTTPGFSFPRISWYFDIVPVM